MKKKIIGIIFGAIIVATIMFAEYRVIMTNIHPYHGDNGTVYLEVFGQVDEYYAESYNQ